VLVSPVLVQLASATGFLAAAIAVGGFLAHAFPAIRGGRDRELRRRTAIGGLLGFATAVFAIAATVIG
jgi:hypothetical protein